MATNQTIENLNDTSETGLKGILKITSIKNSLFTFKVSLIAIFCTVLILFFAIFLPINIYDLIIEINNLTISFLPGILGFTIAGYSLVVAFIPQTNMLHRITERMSNEKFSYFQNMSSIFALNIIFQIFSLILAYLFHFIIYFDTKAKVFLSLPKWYVYIINFAGLFLIAYAFILSLFLVLQIVINIFNFSQTHHFFIVKNKIDNS